MCFSITLFGSAQVLGSYESRNLEESSRDKFPKSRSPLQRKKGMKPISRAHLAAPWRSRQHRPLKKTRFLLRPTRWLRRSTTAHRGAPSSNPKSLPRTSFHIGGRLIIQLARAVPLFRFSLSRQFRNRPMLWFRLLEFIIEYDKLHQDRPWSRMNG